MHGKQLMRSDCSKGGGEHGEFAYSLRTRSDSQRQWDFMSNLNERKVRYLKEGGSCRHQGAHLLVLGVDPPLQNKGDRFAHVKKEQTVGAQRAKSNQTGFV